MTIKELSENNKLIVEFMGGSINQQDDTVNGYKNINLPEWVFKLYDFDKIRTAGYDYHKSWDWLMPVVQKIWLEAVKNEAAYYEAYYIHSGSLTQSIESAYKSCIKFIKWYNEQQNIKP